MPELSKENIKALTVPEGAREAYLWDSDLASFGIRKFNTGRMSFIVKYRVKGEPKTRKISLGEAPDPTPLAVIRKMREIARDTLARARVGEDIQPKKQVKASELTIVTTGEQIRRYIQERGSDVRPRSLLEIKRHLSRRFEALHTLPLREITRDRIVNEVIRIAKEHGRTEADRARASLSAFFASCIERDLLDANPCVGIKRRAPGKSRERVLTLDELKAVWQACDWDDDYPRIVRLLLLTGQRRLEIADLSWDEIDLDKREIRLPAERCKNGRAHVVPLSDHALAILETIPHRAGRKLLFGTGSGGFSGWSAAKRKLDAKLCDVVAPFVLHDLRRSLATHCADMEFAPPHIIEMALNHHSDTRAGIIQVYQRSNHLKQRRELMEKWGAHIAALAGD